MKSKSHMNKGLKAFLWIVVVIMGLGMLLIVLPQCYSHWYNYSERGTKYSIRKDWNVTIPKEADMEYNLVCKEFLGDKGRYIVFSFEKDSTEFIADFLNEKNEEFENLFKSNIAYLESETEEEIPNQYLFDLEGEYYWKHQCNPKEKYSQSAYGYLYMIYSSTTQYLYIYEDYRSYR